MSDLLEFLKSEEGKQSMDEYVRKLIIEQERGDRYVEKFRLLYENNLDYIIKKLLNKYDSDKYVNRERKLGYEPRETLLWLVFEYARKYCEPCEDEKYFNPFTGAAFYIGSYVIQVMHGQGSVIRIDKKLV